MQKDNRERINYEKL